MKLPFLKNICRGKEPEPTTEPFVPLHVINEFKEKHPFPNLTEKQREVLYRAVDAFVIEDLLSRMSRLVVGNGDIGCFREGTGIVDTFGALGLINEQEKYEITELSPLWRNINSSIKRVNEPPKPAS
jgi:hypothetical protein